jgi:hypothetical protein
MDGVKKSAAPDSVTGIPSLDAKRKRPPMARSVSEYSTVNR